ncbi:MAG: FHA domain-containing protein, partial [Acidobacteriota bacterium]
MRIERKLLVRDGENLREVLLVGTVTVGRSPSCEISAADPRLSRAHAAFDVLGDEVVVRDLESRNGTRVNGVRMTEARLVAGDTVEVGPFVMELVETATAPVVVSIDSPTGASAATVLLPPGAPRGFEPPSAAPPVPPASPGPAPMPFGSSAPAGSDDAADAQTRRMPRPPMPAAPAVPVPPPLVPAAAVTAPAPTPAPRPPTPAASRLEPSTAIAMTTPAVVSP